MANYDFSGWATKNDLLCGDGRTIRKDAFKDCDGEEVPLFWNHNHNSLDDVLGHALLENRPEGVYAYCKFNDSENGKEAKRRVDNGDIRSLSIWANQLKQIGGDVIHGVIRELSLVPAGANPGAFIDFVMAHGDDGESGIIAGYDEYLTLYHSAESEKKEEEKVKMENEKKTESEKTVQDVLDTMNEDQLNVMYALIGKAIEDSEGTEDYNDEGDGKMKHNLFDNETNEEETFLSHADEEAILNLAKSKSCGSLQDAITMFTEDNGTLSHGIDDIETLFPDFYDLNPDKPDTITRDQTWVGQVINGVHKTPYSRIRNKFADARGDDLRAFGYQKGNLKKYPGNIKLMKRTTDPQTIYVREALHRDDIVDITDFDVVAYTHENMKRDLYEELATAVLFGDGRDDADPDKISEEHIRSIWHDDDLYTIHTDVDIDGMKATLQGTNTSANFGENYIYAEAIIQSSLYAREKYKGSGNLAFYCTPHLVNVMLLARDLNGRRIFDSVTDLKAALNVSAIHTVEQMEGKTRTANSKTKKLLGLFVNLNDYSMGSTKGGEITSFNQFDIDFNQEKYLIETRVSGALTKLWSAIALEEDVTGK